MSRTSAESPSGRGRRGRAAAAAVFLGILAVGALLTRGFPISVYPSNDPELPAAVEQIGLDDGPLMTVHRDTVPVCSGCRVGLALAGRFGDPEDPFLMWGGLPLVERDSRGRFHATVPGGEFREIIVYAPDGEILTTVGGPGGGPGEFASPVWDLRMGPGDTLFVLHGRTISLFDSAGAFARSVSLDPPPSAPQMNRLIGLLDDGGLAFSEFRLGDPSGTPIHVYDSTGDYRGGFGPPLVMVVYLREQGRHTSTMPRVAVWDAAAQAYWLAGPGYRVERADPEGRVDRVIGVDGPPRWEHRLHMTEEDYRRWSENQPPAPPAAGWDPGEDPTPARPLPLTIPARGLAPLGDSLLAVAALVPSHDREEAQLELDPPGGHGTPLGPEHLMRVQDTVVDIIHVGTGAVLARTRVPGPAALTADGTLYVHAIDSLGVVSVRAYEVSLRESEALPDVD